jgi:hypothetical protein
MNSNFETYIYEGQRVVLLYDAEVSYWSPSIAPLAYGGEYNPYPLVEDIIQGIRCGMLHPNLCYDDSYANDCVGEYTGEVDIIRAKVRDIESPNSLTEQYVTKLFAVLDEAKRELAVTTTEDDGWHSKREYMMEKLKSMSDNDITQRLQALRESWEQVIEEGGYDKAISDAITKRESYPFNGYVADAQNYLFTPLAESKDCSFESILFECGYLDKEEAIGASILIYPTNADIFVGDQVFNIDLDFQDPEFFESTEEAEDWITQMLLRRVQDHVDDTISNLDDIKDKLMGVLNRYTK